MMMKFLVIVILYEQKILLLLTLHVKNNVEKKVCNQINHRASVVTAV